MDGILQLFGGFGLLGILVALLLGLVVLIVLPWCCLIECVRSNRSSGVRAFLAVMLVLTWGFGSLVYGLFITRSRPLRFFSWASVMLVLLIGVPAAVMLGTSTAALHESRLEHQRLAQEAAEAAFQPSQLAEGELGPFAAILFGGSDGPPSTATLTTFDGAQPDAGSARDIDTRVRHVLRDPQQERTFALTTHEFGTITPSSGRFARIEVDPSLGDFGWPKGLAYDPAQDSVLLMTSHVYTRFYRYDPRTSDWRRLPSELRGPSLRGLTYLPAAESFFSVVEESGSGTIRELQRFNGEGAFLGSLTLDSPVPVADGQVDLLQLRTSGERLVLVLPDRIVAVDPASGQVSVPPA